MSPSVNSGVHPRWVRISHWIAAASLLALAFSGSEILMVHPRLYWGDAGNDLMPALIELPISRNYKHGGWDAPMPFSGDPSAPVSAGRTYDIFNENGWGRSLHFLAAWWLVATGAVYAMLGFARGHFRFTRYGRLQKVTYVVVIFVAAPLMVATGITMAPAVTAAFPFLLRLFGGYQSARTIHFFTFAALVLFVIGHVTMVARSGFKRQLRGMIAGD
jgi:cytochrome b subunit of formate dehydrogenase